jgi:hypothetical protein
MSGNRDEIKSLKRVLDASHKRMHELERSFTFPISTSIAQLLNLLFDDLLPEEKSQSTAFSEREKLLREENELLQEAECVFHQIRGHQFVLSFIQVSART